jgi:hypothetical protein
MKINNDRGSVSSVINDILNGNKSSIDSFQWHLYAEFSGLYVAISGLYMQNVVISLCSNQWSYIKQSVSFICSNWWSISKIIISSKQ